jgi:hypothetical protein
MLNWITVTKLDNTDEGIAITAIIWETDEEFKILEVDWTSSRINTKITNEGITNIIEEYAHNINEIFLTYWNVFSNINIESIDKFIGYLGEDLHSTNSKIRGQVIAWINSIANWWKLERFISSINYEADDTKKKIKEKIKIFIKPELLK